MFYFERYNNHNKSEKHARALRPVISSKITLLHELKQFPLSELEFLSQAVDEVIKCCQVLKWTYVFAFYILDSKEKQLFEFMQENLEKNCDQLYELVEKPLDPYLDTYIIDRSPFYMFKSQLVNFYQVTK